MLILLVVLAVAAVLFVAAVLATQEGDVLVDAPPDRPDVDLPAGRVVAEDLRSVRFGMVLRGYRMSEVDDVLERLGGELAERDERIVDLERALAEVVEPAVREAEARHAAREPAAEAEPEPEPAPAAAAALPDVEALTATDDAFAPESAPEAVAGEQELTPLPEEWVSAASAAPAASEPSPVVEPSTDPLDPGWEPSTVERSLGLVASYRVTVPGHGHPVVPPETAAPEGEAAESETSAAPPAGEASSEAAEDEGFPEVEPAEPAPGWAPEERDLGGDDGRERRPSSEP